MVIVPSPYDRPDLSYQKEPYFTTYAPDVLHRQSQPMSVSHG